MRTPRKATTLIAICTIGLALATLTGCSSSGGKSSEDKPGSGSGQGVKGAGTPRMKIAMVTHSGEGDTFWDIVQSGAKQAAAKDNVEVPLLRTTRRARSRPSSSRPPSTRRSTGIVVTLAKPEAVKAVVAKAVKAGIPVVTINSGARVLRGGRRARPHRAGRVGGRRGRRRGTEQARPEEGRLRHPRTGQRVAGGALRRGEEDLQGRGREPQRRGHQHARLHLLHRGEAPGRPRPSTRSSPSARRSPPSPSRPRRSAGAKAEVDTFDLNAEVVKRLKAQGGRLRRRPAALPPGLSRRRRAVAQQDQRRRHRRRQAGAHRPGDRHRRRTSRSWRSTPRAAPDDPGTRATAHSPSRHTSPDPWPGGADRRSGILGQPDREADARQAAPSGYSEQQQEGHGLVARVRTGVRAIGAVLAAVLGASLAGCSSTGGKRAEERAAQAAAAAGPR